MKKAGIIFTILFILSTSAFALTEDERNTMEVYNRTHNGVVLILNKMELGGTLGSGAVIAKGGYIVTNFHMVADTKGLFIVDYDPTKEKKEMTRYPAKIVGIDKDNDLAIVKVEGPTERLTVIPIDKAGMTVPGQKVIIIGQPNGFHNSVSVGIVGGLRTAKEVEADWFVGGKLIQTDADIHGGNSGGPMLNSDGQIIGIVSFTMISDKGDGAVGFGVASEHVLALMKKCGVEG